MLKVRFLPSGVGSALPVLLIVDSKSGGARPTEYVGDGKRWTKEAQGR